MIVMPTVLVIDDDKTLYDLIKNALSMVQIDCEFVTTAEAGFEFIQTHQPHLILMDLMLPRGLKGWEAIASLKSNPQTSHIPIIAFTAGTGLYIKQAMDAGAADFIIKPFSISQFQKVIMQYIGACQP